jgi:hypothetical protein
VVTIASGKITGRPSFRLCYVVKVGDGSLVCQP